MSYPPSTSSSGAVGVTLVREAQYGRGGADRDAEDLDIELAERGRLLDHKEESEELPPDLEAGMDVLSSSESCVVVGPEKTLSWLHGTAFILSCIIGAVSSSMD